jgi:hypothetical protein
MPTVLLVIALLAPMGFGVQRFQKAILQKIFVVVSVITVLSYANLSLVGTVVASPCEAQSTISIFDNATIE